jgi:hypothetical protein
LRRAATLLALLAAACSHAARTADEALADLRASVAAGDGEAFYRLLDSESAAQARATVRERRALLARGDDAAQVLRGMPITREELESGDEAEVAARFFPRASPIFRDAPWFATSTVADERADGADAMLVRMRGADGVERPLWFVREAGAWRFDLARTQREW